MTAYLRDYTVVDVVDARTLAAYAQQHAGIPLPRGNEYPRLRRACNDYLKATPAADWHTLAKVVDWARARKRRIASVAALPSLARYAWADGYLPELDPTGVDEELEAAVRRALATETDPEWRRRLIASKGRTARREVYEWWRQVRVSSPS